MVGGLQVCDGRGKGVQWEDASVYCCVGSCVCALSPPLPQELEVMAIARAHSMPTQALMPETKPLAQAAETALGSVTPRSSTSRAITPVSLLTPQRSARETSVDLTELVQNSPSINLRASPGLDVVKLNLDDSRGLTHSPHTPRLEQIMEDESTQPSSHPVLHSCCRIPIEACYSILEVLSSPLMSTFLICTCFIYICMHACQYSCVVFM